jgi:hypothetical protein
MRRGWSLPEAMFVSMLTALVVLIVTNTLASTSRWTRLESQKGFAMGQLQSTLAQIETLLQRSCSAGVAYLPPVSGRPAILAMHLQDPAAYASTPLWEAQWNCLSWGRQELRHFTSPGARTNLPLAPTPAQLDQFAASTGRQRLLVGDVTDFQYSLLVGPVAQVRLRLEIDVGRAKSETIEMSRKIYFRNRI